jgi:hypothetical protein
MPFGYSLTPKLQKGALVELSEPFLGPIPNIILFQYNPESFTRDLEPWSPPTAEEGEQPTESTAQPFDPGETFSLTLELDASDALEEPILHPVAVVAGIADRIAALEMLLYPLGDSLLGARFAKFFGQTDLVPRASVPIVLFIWGPGRIVPVRIERFSVEEQAFNPLLYPIRAKVSIGLRVLTDAAFVRPDRELTSAEELAVEAYKWTRKQKEALARANLLNSAESALGMLPF